MGVAAYNRGSKLISEQIQREYFKDSGTLIRERVNSLEPGTQRLFCATIARPDPSRRGWLLMNRKDKGYGEQSMHFKSLDAIRKHFKIQLGFFCQDEHSYYWEILPL